MDGQEKDKHFQKKKNKKKQKKQKSSTSSECTKIIYLLENEFSQELPGSTRVYYTLNPTTAQALKMQVLHQLLDLTPPVHNNSQALL